MTININSCSFLKMGKSQPLPSVLDWITWEPDDEMEVLFTGDLLGSTLRTTRVRGEGSRIRQKERDQLRCSFVFCFFFFLRAAPVAYESSQARGQTRAEATQLHHSSAIPDPINVCNLHHSSQQH